MMKIHEKVFLSLVRNSLWNTQVEVPAEFKDWSLVMCLAGSQALQGTVAKALLDNPSELDRMKPDAESKLKNILMTNMVMHSMANSTLQELVKTLDNAGIKYVLLKGQGLAANYPDPELRECGDIDLYVGTEQYLQSYEVLKDVVDEIDDAAVFKGGGKHYHAMRSGISIEIHKYSEILSSLSLDKTYQRYANVGLSQNLAGLNFGESMVWTPADDFNAFYVFNHLWNHFLSVGIGLRQICDWTMLLHSRGHNIDRKYLQEILTEMKLMKPWKTFGCIVVNILGLPEEEFPFYDPKYGKKAQKVLERIMTDGDMGRETEFIRKSNKGYLHEKLFSMKFYIKRFNQLTRLFPYHAFLRLSHSIANGIKLLFKDFIVYLRLQNFNR